MPFTIYFNDCDDAYIVPVTNFKISSNLSANSDSDEEDCADDSVNCETYSTLSSIGFASSDETNCPIDGGTFLDPVPVFCTGDSPLCVDTATVDPDATSLLYYWATVTVTDADTGTVTNAF